MESERNRSINRYLTFRSLDASAKVTWCDVTHTIVRRRVREQNAGTWSAGVERESGQGLGYAHLLRVRAYTN